MNWIPGGWGWARRARRMQGGLALVYLALLSQASGLWTPAAPAATGLLRGRKLCLPRCPRSFQQVFCSRVFDRYRAEGSQGSYHRHFLRARPSCLLMSGRGMGRSHRAVDTLNSVQAQSWEQPPPDGADLSVYYRARISYCTQRRARAVSMISAVDLLIEDLPGFDLVEVAGMLVRAHKCLLGIVAHPRAGLRQQRAAWAATRRYDLSLVVCSDAFLSRMNAEWHGRGVADKRSDPENVAERRGQVQSPRGVEGRDVHDVRWLCFPQLTKRGMVGDLLVSYEAAARSARPPTSLDRRAPDYNKRVKLEIRRQLIRTVLQGLVALLDISVDEEQQMVPYMHEIVCDDSFSRGSLIAQSEQVLSRPRGRRAARGRGRAGARDSSREGRVGETASPRLGGRHAAPSAVRRGRRRAGGGRGRGWRTSREADS